MSHFMKLRTVFFTGLSTLVIALGSAANAAPGHAYGNMMPSCGFNCVSEYDVTPATEGPFGLAAGPDGALWFSHGDGVGRMSMTGQETDYAVPTPNADVGWITPGPDGAMWFAERFGNKIGRITMSGAVTEYQIPSQALQDDGTLGSSVPHGLVFTLDHSLWFTEQFADKIGHLTPDGHITEYQVPTPNAGPQGLALGSDGALWFTERYASQIGRITTSGHFTEYALDPNATPQRITSGPDNALWFTELGTSKVGRITTDGRLTEYPVGSRPVGITGGPDGSIWIVEFGPGKIGRLSLGGKLLAEYPIPTADSGALQITLGPDGALWFGEDAANKLGRLQPQPPAQPHGQNVYVPRYGVR